VYNDIFLTNHLKGVALSHTMQLPLNSTGIRFPLTALYLLTDQTITKYTMQYSFKFQVS